MSENSWRNRGSGKESDWSRPRNNRSRYGRYGNSDKDKNSDEGDNKRPLKEDSRKNNNYRNKKNLHDNQNTMENNKKDKKVAPNAETDFPELGNKNTVQVDNKSHEPTNSWSQIWST